MQSALLPCSAPPTSILPHVLVEAQATSAQGAATTKWVQLLLWAGAAMQWVQWRASHFPPVHTRATSPTKCIVHDPGFQVLRNGNSGLGHQNLLSITLLCPTAYPEPTAISSHTGNKWECLLTLPPPSLEDLTPNFPSYSFNISGCGGDDFEIELTPIWRQWLT
ncbi:hypothetical protein B0H10DRAFT_1937629 [Mycena sp. CBHHK59/15]|nr:hypothetical protein B0H10DRAFT_1937629 [Mycena sp. CBHHK59/15]